MTPTHQFQQRAQTFLQNFQPHQAILLSTPADISYFTGFEFLTPTEREAFFLLTAKGCFLIQASFAPSPTDQYYTILEHCRPDYLASHLLHVFQNTELTELMIDTSTLFVEEHQAVTAKISSLGVSLSPLDRQLIWNQRLIKDPAEITLMRRAARIAQQSLVTIQPQLHEGMTEKELSLLLEWEMRQSGADGVAFPTIVAFGDHGASPHYQPADTKLQNETPVLIDFGARVQGYHSDITRSFWFGAKPSPEFSKVAKTVNEAYQAAKNVLDQNTPTSPPFAKQLDEAARATITEAGYGPQFIHTTGHGVGLDIHEQPSVNWKSEVLLKPGMIITIEPGIYLEGQFGFRYENTILITDQGAEELTL